MTLTGKLFRDAVISGANNIANNRAALSQPTLATSGEST